MNNVEMINLKERIKSVDYYLEKFDLKEKLPVVTVCPSSYMRIRDKNDDGPNYFCTRCLSEGSTMEDFNHNCQDSRYLYPTDYVNRTSLTTDVVFLVDDVSTDSFSIIKLERNIVDPRRKGKSKEEDANISFDITEYREEFIVKGGLFFENGYVDIVRLTPSGQLRKCDIKQFNTYRKFDYTKTTNLNMAEVLNCDNFANRTGYKELVELNKRNMHLSKLLGFIRVRVIEGFNSFELIAKAQPIIARCLESRYNTFPIDTRRDANFYNTSLFSRKGKRLKDVLNLTSSHISILNNIVEEERIANRHLLDLDSVILTLERFYDATGEYMNTELLELLIRDYQDHRETIHLTKAIDRAGKIISYKEFKIRQKDIASYLYYADLNQAIPHSEGIALWGDYLYMCKHMNMEPKKYPKSLVREHDVAARSFEYIKHKVVEMEFQKRVESLSELEYSNSEFTIRVPRTTTEVIDEGKILRHCVASYIKKISDGSSTVLFLRKNTELNKPFVTVEYQNGSIVQAKGYLNSNSIGWEAKEFLSEWLGWLKDSQYASQICV